MSAFYPQIEHQVEYFINLIKNSDLGNEYRIYDEFNDALTENPLIHPTATVGIKSLESESVWIGDFLGKKAGEAVGGKLVTVTYELTVHSPVTMGGSACTRFLCKVRDTLYGTENLLFSNVTSGEIKYDRSRRCLYMPVRFAVKYII